MRRRNRPRKVHGFLTADVMMGLMIIAVLAVVLVATMAQHRKGAERLSDTRGAVWAAERALATLQTGAAVNDKTITVEPVLGDVAAPAGQKWVRVRATFNDRSATLLGLVPATKEAK